jgi:hypothetical protein
VAPTYTYDDTLPTDKDLARAALGDTDMDAPIFSDEHITAVLTIRGNVADGVASLAGELVATYSHQPVKKSAYGVSVDYTDRIAAWRQIALAAATGGRGAFAVASPRADGYAENAAADEFAR